MYVSMFSLFFDFTAIHSDTSERDFEIQKPYSFKNEKYTFRTHRVYF